MEAIQWVVTCVYMCYRADGRAQLHVTAPDTITSWVASAFAISSDVGLGVAPDTARVSSIHCYLLPLTLCDVMGGPRYSTC